MSTYIDLSTTGTLLNIYVYPDKAKKSSVLYGHVMHRNNDST